MVTGSDPGEACEAAAWPAFPITAPRLWDKTKPRFPGGDTPAAEPHLPALSCMGRAGDAGRGQLPGTGCVSSGGSPEQVRDLEGCPQEASSSLCPRAEPETGQLTSHGSQSRGCRETHVPSATCQALGCCAAAPQAPALWGSGAASSPVNVGTPGRAAGLSRNSVGSSSSAPGATSSLPEKPGSHFAELNLRRRPASLRQPSWAPAVTGSSRFELTPFLSRVPGITPSPASSHLLNYPLASENGSPQRM